MKNGMIKSIESWFARHDDGEFAGGMRCLPYTVIAPMPGARRIIYTTKPTLISAVYARRVPVKLGMIVRYGLPSQADLPWIRKLVGSCELLFFGDLDPPDLMVFAWLRAALGSDRVVHLGVSDALLSALKSSSAGISFRCAPSEMKSLALLRQVFPDLIQTIGQDCARLVEAGNKIELEAVGRHAGIGAAIARLARSSRKLAGRR